ncbi:AAA family ATPase [Streptomyces sp. NPDC058955]|uniref:helix-turn-helix transcriptional regulator n=1 Tax=unclassified Streptomyces TaxID=2593676 RepID=UPI00364E7789
MERGRTDDSMGAGSPADDSTGIGSMGVDQPLPWPLTGRGWVTERLDALLTGLRDRSGVRPLLLRGEAGMGRSALLASFADRAERQGVLVLRGSGVPAESSMPYAALHQLLCPVRSRVDALPPDEARILGATLSTGAPADPFLLCNAVLRLLRLTSEETPVLLALDDTHWFDAQSLGVISFLARRTWDAALALVAAATTSAPGPFDGDVPEMLLGPLGRREATAVLDLHHPGLARNVVERVVTEAGGVPLALVELPRALGADQRRGTEPLPAYLPLGQRLLRTFAPRLRELPDHVRELLLLTALEGSGDTRAVWSAHSQGWEVAGRAYVAAEDAGMLRVGERDGRTVFCHPLLRAVAVAESSADRRRAAHRALANVPGTPAERQVHHLTLSAVGVEPTAAHALAAGAVRVAATGAATVALTSLTQAAEHAYEAGDRAAFLTRAARSAARAGSLGEAADLLARADRESPGADPVAAALTRSILVAEENGDGRAALALLLGAFDSYQNGPAGDDGGRDEILGRLIHLAMATADAELWHATSSRLGTGPAWARLVRDVSTPLVGQDHRLPARLAAAVDEFPEDVSAGHVLRLASCALAVDAMEPFRGPLARVIDRGRRGGAVLDVTEALGLLGLDALLCGEREKAVALTTEMLALAERHTLRLTTSYAQAQLALVTAASGDPIPAAEAAPGTEGSGPTAVMAHQARAWEALARGEYERAHAHTARASAAAADGPALSPLQPALLLDLVETAVRTGRSHEARMHLSGAEAKGLAHRSEQHRLAVAAARVMVAPRAEASAMRDAVLSLPGARSGSFALARLAAFLEPMAASKPRDSSPPAPAPERCPPDNPADLTRQELQIARLAASGLSNKEIGERLFLSPRTVSTHLYNLFPKLGVRSRAALHERLLGLGYAAPERLLSPAV